MGRPRGPPTRSQQTRKADDGKPPFKTIVKINYDDAKLYRPVSKDGDPCSSHGQASAPLPAPRSDPRPQPRAREQQAGVGGNLRAISRHRIVPARRRVPPASTQVANAVREVLQAAGRPGAILRHAPSAVVRDAAPVAAAPVTTFVSATNIKKSALKRRSNRRGQVDEVASQEDSTVPASQPRSTKRVQFARRMSSNGPTGVQNENSGDNGAPASASLPVAAGIGTPVSVEVIAPATPSGTAGVAGTGSPVVGKRNSRNAGSTPWNAGKVNGRDQGGEYGGPVEADKPEEEEVEDSESADVEDVVVERRSSRKSARASKRVSHKPSLAVLVESVQMSLPGPSGFNTTTFEIGAAANTRRSSRRSSRKSVLPTDSEFLAMYEEELKRLGDLRQRWTAVKNDVETWPEAENDDGNAEKMSKEDALWRINAAEWSAKKVMDGLLRQFKDLYDQRVENRDPSRPVLLADLKGFWDRIHKPIEDVVKDFEDLSKLEANGWVEPPPPKRVSNVGRPAGRTRRSGAGKVKRTAKPKAGSGTAATGARANLRQLIAAGRKKMADVGGDEDAAGSDGTVAPADPVPQAQSGSRKSGAKKRKTAEKALETEPQGAAAFPANVQPEMKKKRSKSARGTRSKLPAEPAVEVGLFEEVLDDIEPGMATTIGAHLVEDPVTTPADDDDDYDENVPQHEIIPSPDRIGLHRLTPGEKAFDALLTKPSFEHGDKPSGKTPKSAADKGLRTSNRAVAKEGVVATPVARVTRSTMK